jgi:exosome complex component RRP41|tara:strand:+ start:1387 stop:2085 length:699 start_codon:yes stop_codon:yes gene_type:complete
MSRPDKRKVDETRPIESKAGVIAKADGSAMFKIGNTVAYAAVYGPRSLHPRFLQNPKKGIIRVNYNMMPFSGCGDRIRPGTSRRSKEISMVTTNALTSVVDLDQFPNAVVDIFIELPQTDAGTRCAGICAASIALADAGIVMKEMVSSIAVGLVNGKPVVDLSKEEEDLEGAVDVPIAVLPNSGKVTLLQLDGEIKPGDLKKAIEMGQKVCKRINKVMIQTLKDKYKVDKNE